MTTPNPFIATTQEVSVTGVPDMVFSGNTIDGIIQGLILNGYSSAVRFGSDNLQSLVVLKNPDDANFTVRIGLVNPRPTIAPSTAVDATHFAVVTHTVTATKIEPYTATPEQIDGIIAGLIATGFTSDVAFTSTNLKAFAVFRAAPDGSRFVVKTRLA
jgi:hypothetical protein